MKRLALVLFLGMAVVFANAQTKTSVKTEDLQKAITDNIAKDFKDYKIQHAFKVDTKSVITYEIMVKKDAQLLILTYDANGKFIKKDEPRKSEAKPAVKTTTTTTTTTTTKPEPKKDPAPTAPTK
ncbi:MAG: hypothetical protein NTW49_07270 [Bacteroidia bacterium]|nr:hypothetical protein [Bacteroidia bacterium]